MCLSANGRRGCMRSAKCAQPNRPVTAGAGNALAAPSPCRLNRNRKGTRASTTKRPSLSEKLRQRTEL